MRHADLVKRVLAKRLQESLVDNNKTEIVRVSDEATIVQDESVLPQSSDEKTLETVDAPIVEEASKKKNNLSPKKKKNAST